MIYKCEACKDEFVCMKGIQKLGTFTMEVNDPDGTERIFEFCKEAKEIATPGLCPGCSLKWFKRLARGERPEWVTRGKR